MTVPDRPLLQQQIEECTVDLSHELHRLRAHYARLPDGAGQRIGELVDALEAVRSRLEAIQSQVVAHEVELGQLRALAETTALVNSSLEIDQVLNEVMDRVIALSGAERGYIVLRDDDTGEMAFRIARNMQRETLDERAFIVSRTIVDEVAQTGQPVVTTNAQSDPRFSAQESVMFYALRSILCVPLIVRGEVIGVVYADNRIKDGLFSDRELAVLVGLAGQAAIAIENARLFRRVRRAIAEVTQIKELMDNVFESIASGVLAMDLAGRVTTFNAAAEAILGVPRDEVIGRPIAEALPDVYPAMAGQVAHVIDRRESCTVEISYAHEAQAEQYWNLKLSPLETDGELEGVAVVVDDLTALKQRDETLQVVRRYLPPVLVDNIQNVDHLGLGGERRMVTAMFVEVRSFASFPSHWRPSDLMTALNLYLTVGAEAVHDQQGIIDKFMGNEMMGLFNTQLNPMEDHGWRAIQAALRMSDEFLALAERLGGGRTPYFRIGIHAGVVTVGNVGSPSRRDFTAIGDAINLAKRLQENAMPGEIIVSNVVCDLCRLWLDDPASGVRAEERASVQVKGRRQPVQIFAISRCDAQAQAG